MLKIISVQFLADESQATSDYPLTYRELLLKVDNYPVSIDKITLHIIFTSDEGMDISHFIRVRSSDGYIIYETDAFTIHIHDADYIGVDQEITANLPDVSIPSPGTYFFDIMFDGVSLHSEPLRITKDKRKNDG